MIMNRRKMLSLLMLVIFAAANAAMPVTSTAQQKGKNPGKPTRVEKGRGPSANGHGTFKTETGVVNLSFHAAQFNDGTVRGSANFHFEQLVEVKLLIDITCLSIVVDPVTGVRTAILSGFIVKSNDERDIGDFVFFRAIDNGTRPNARDEISSTQAREPGNAEPCNQLFIAQKTRFR
jgi:hypothetical protein